MTSHRWNAIERCTLLALALAAGLYSAPPLRAAVVPPDSAGGPSCWVLLYTGGSVGRRFPARDLVDFFAVVDTADQPTAWMCEGAIVLDLQATSGRYYYPWPDKASAKGQDWNAYLDSLFSPHGRLQSLDSAVALISSKAGPPGGGFRVALMIPYPFPNADTVWIAQGAFAFGEPDGRQRAVEAYVNEVVHRFASTRLQRLQLAGYYWLNEEIRTGDSTLTKRTADAIHRRGLEFLWIPYYTAPSAGSWRVFGFDHAWLQPNYFFHPEVSVLRLDSAVSRARAAGMGIELEFNPKMFDQWQFADRLEPYLTVLGAADDLRARSVAIYEGVGALIQLARSRDTWHRALYNRLVTTLREAGSRQRATTRGAP